MLKEKILAGFDREVRANPGYPVTVKVVKDEYVTRLGGLFNFVCYWQFTEQQARQVIHEQADKFRQLDEKLDWRVYSHDEPCNIESCLQQEGFEITDSGTLMVLCLDEVEVRNSDHVIKELQEASELDDFFNVTGVSFGSVNRHDLEYFSQLVAFPNFKFYVGFCDETPISAGRLECPFDTVFGLLFGGCVLPGYRNRGYYKSLINARVKVAKRQGLKYLTTEARDTSKPILESLGFIPLATENTWSLHPGRNAG